MGLCFLFGCDDYVLIFSLISCSFPPFADKLAVRNNQGCDCDVAMVCRYAWTVASCSTCETHMGWLFTATKKKLKPKSFWGIRSSQVAEGTC